jgi:hypothetical protein
MVPGLVAIALIRFLVAQALERRRGRAGALLLMSLLRDGRRKENLVGLSGRRSAKVLRDCEMLTDGKHQSENHRVFFFE